MPPTKQLWYCETCERGSRIVVEDHEDIGFVLHKIKYSHSQVSPNCPAPYGNIRVVNMALIPSLT